MFQTYFDAGGPVMFVVFGAWLIVLAGVLDRLFYAVGRGFRRPMDDVVALLKGGSVDEAQRRLELERLRAARSISRIDSVSQIATSIGLFGTVLGIARAFYGDGAPGGIADPDALASGLSTALFTTVAGLVVFLFGQGFLIAWREWESLCERRVREASA